MEVKGKASILRMPFRMNLWDRFVDAESVQESSRGRSDAPGSSLEDFHDPEGVARTLQLRDDNLIQSAVATPLRRRTHSKAFKRPPSFNQQRPP